MLKPSALRSRHRNAPRPAWKVAEAFKQWLRGRLCACAGPNCSGPMVAAHVDHAGGKGMGSKVSDRFCIPLCDWHHRKQHSIGWRRFERAFLAADAVKLSEDYWRAWPGRAKWEAQNDG